MCIFRVFKRKMGIKEEPKKVAIGIALFTTYTSCMGNGTFFYHPSTEVLNAPGFGARDFFEFYSEELTENRKTEYKIKGTWLLKSEVLMYKNIKNGMEKNIYLNRMKKKFQLHEFTKIHQLYNDGLTVDFSFLSNPKNNFKNKKLEKEIMES